MTTRLTGLTSKKKDNFNSIIISWLCDLNSMLRLRDLDIDFNIDFNVIFCFQPNF